MRNIAIFLIFLFGNCSAWNNNNNWNWGNNNVAIGYPTAYGLYSGRGGGWGNYNNGAPPNVVRCLNGGAHIGQCRLDKDSICIALGGSCTHGACCTTPFVGIFGSTVGTTVPPEMIDGETTKRKTRGRSTTTTVAPEPNSEEMEEYNQLVERATVSPHIEENQERKCSSGLRSVGPCSEDSDCPTLHQCEKEQCCYLVL